MKQIIQLQTGDIQLLKSGELLSLVLASGVSIGLCFETRRRGQLDLQQKEGQKCGECGYTCLSKSGLYQHIRKYHKGGKKLKFQCSICKKEFFSTETRKIHEKRFHKKVRP